MSSWPLAEILRPDCVVWIVIGAVFSGTARNAAATAEAKVGRDTGGGASGGGSVAPSGARHRIRPAWSKPDTNKPVGQLCPSMFNGGVVPGGPGGPSGPCGPCGP